MITMMVSLLRAIFTLWLCVFVLKGGLGYETTKMMLIRVLIDRYKQCKKDAYNQYQHCKNNCHYKREPEAEPTNNNYNNCKNNW